MNMRTPTRNKITPLLNFRKSGFFCHDFSASLFCKWLSVACALVTAPLRAAEPAHDYPVKPVPFTAVHLTDTFWAPRIETNRLVTIPFAFEQCEKSGRMDNFDRAAKALAGEVLDNK